MDFPDRRSAASGMTNCRLRSPDAAQRAATSAWCAAGPGSTALVVATLLMIGPGSAKQRYTLHRVRDTRIKLPQQPSLRAQAKQSILFNPWIARAYAVGRRFVPRNADCRLRSPDAAQRAATAAWCAADPGSTARVVATLLMIGPGSAKQRYTLHRVRDTRIV